MAGAQVVAPNFCRQKDLITPTRPRRQRAPDDDASADIDLFVVESGRRFRAAREQLQSPLDEILRFSRSG